MNQAGRALALGGLSLLLGGIAAADVRERESAVRASIGPLVPVLVAGRPIAAGSRIARERLAVRRVPARFAPRGAFHAAIEVVGARAGVAIASGADLTPALLAQAGPAAGQALATLRPGERIARIVAVGASGELPPGSRADVLVSTGDAPTRIALEGAEILESRPASAPADGEGAAAALPRVILALRVTLRQAVELTQAQNGSGQLQALARP